MSENSEPIKFPRPRETILLIILVFAQFWWHRGMDSPYLYSTKDQQVMEEGVYGMRLGPNGEMIHFDAVNYWSMETLFSGNFRGGHIGTINRPAYGYVMSLLDRYVHKVYAGWMVNLFFWIVSSLFAFSLVRYLGGTYVISILGMFLYACSPGFVNTSGQPLGYIMGYGLFTIFASVMVRLDYYQKHPLNYCAIMGFILCAADLTYELLGPICGLFLIFFGLGKIRFAHIALIGAAVLTVKAGWHGLITSHLFSGIAATISVTGAEAARESAFYIRGQSIISALSALGFGLFVSTFAFPTLLILLFGYRATPIQRRLILAGTGAVTLPLFYLGIIGESTGTFRFYKHGRLIAYYAPVIMMFTPALLDSFLGKWSRSSRVRLGIGTAFVAAVILITNLDITGFKWLYHLFNYREGFRFV